MQKNEEACCGNCPYSTNPHNNEHNGLPCVDCTNGPNGSRLSHYTTYCCPQHPNFYGFLTAKCGECAWTGAKFEVDKRPGAYCRRVAWAYHMQTFNNDDGVIAAKVETSTGMVYLDSPACPAYMPCGERTTEEENDE